MRIWTVDAFADKLFSGNPAAVCVVELFPADAFMQSVATEMNLSETAFVVRLAGNYFHVRWFTPAVEVRLCGHATLASAHILWQEKFANAKDPIRFESLSGPLTVTKEIDGKMMTLNLPAQPALEPFESVELTQALGTKPLFVGRAYDDCLVEVESEPVLRGLTPDMQILRKFNCRGIIVTARSGGGQYDFVSRFFAPREGVLEDPVTGSAHCKLAPYWAKKLGKLDFIAYQASPRGGILHVRLQQDRVLIAGTAITVLTGDISVP